MKTLLRSVLLAAFSVMCLSASAQQKSGIPLIGDKAPAFSAKTTQGTMNFPGDFLGKWKIIFSHPADFTAVCSSEIFELALMQEDFKKLNTAIMVLSTDGINSHHEWINSIEEMRYKDRDSKEIDFPLIADDMMEVSKIYGMIHPAANTKHTVRAVFIIDPEDIIRVILYYPSEIGRNLEEVKRVLLALQLEEKREILTPANWLPGEDVMLPSPANKDEAKKMEGKIGDKVYKLNWYMWFQKIN